MAYLYRAYSAERMESIRQSLSDALLSWAENLGLGECRVTNMQACTEEVSQDLAQFGDELVQAEAGLAQFEIVYRVIYKNKHLKLTSPSEDQIHMMNTLFSKLKGVIGNSTINQTGIAVLEDAHRFGSGWLIANVDVAGCEITLRLSPILFEKRADKPADTMDMGKPLDLLDNEKIQLKVSLGAATISLGDLRNLDVGDVVTLNHGVNQPAQVENQQGKVLFKGRLGSKDGQRALALVK
ncbi:MAG: FliM/FliN family flagellar motor C-terminal domain-containing protein [Pseudomonadales bacterium]|nr:FliM/FliN family flagellar motor C-terminal domain-containing protein [Pseudomonadales bacterium]